MSDDAYLDEVAGRLAASGLIIRGGFRFAAGEDPPAAASGRPARAVVLIGHAGGSIWPHFAAWRQGQDGKLDDPLDTWSREVIGAVARSAGARAVFPSDRPYLPFQTWAMRAEGLLPSPLGILIHPLFGLWHAYRGALLTDLDVAIQPPDKTVHLCDLCDRKPCVKCCPAGAISVQGPDVRRCGSHLAMADGKICREEGCLARLACPHDAYRYGPEQITFHQSAYERSIAARN